VGWTAFYSHTDYLFREFESLGKMDLCGPLSFSGNCDFLFIRERFLSVTPVPKVRWVSLASLSYGQSSELDLHPVMEPSPRKGMGRLPA